MIAVCCKEKGREKLDLKLFQGGGGERWAVLSQKNLTRNLRGYLDAAGTALFYD